MADQTKKEEWRWFSDFYEVSNLGNVRSWVPRGSFTKTPPKMPDHPRPIKCLIQKSRSKQKCSGGYCIIRVCGSDKRAGWYYVHQLVLEAFVGPCPEDMEACHNNGIRKDNRLENLRWDTKKNNMIDRDSHNKTARGSRNGYSKLNEEKVRYIKISLKQGISGASLAREVGVNKEAIYKIKNNTTWNHVVVD